MPATVSPVEIARAAQLLRTRGLVAFPTETVYGLGASALDAKSVARIYAVKGRPATSPLIVHVASIEMAQSLVTAWPEAATLLARKFWPGPLTLVLPKRAIIPDIVTAGLPTVGLRMPAHPVALSLIRFAGFPLAAPSANRFTELSPTTADHVRQGLGADVDLILDGGPCHIGIESTVLSLSGPNPTLLRPGGVSRAEIEAIVGSIAGQIAGPITAMPDAQSGAHASPGMHPRHYSPRTRLLLTEKGNLPVEGRGIYLQYDHPPGSSNVDSRQMPVAAPEYAAELYQALHQADSGRYAWIAVDLPPNTSEWEAIHDRLRRAASG